MGGKIGGEPMDVGMSAVLRTLGENLGLDALARLRLRLWVRRGIHLALGGARALGLAPPRAVLGSPLVLSYHRIARARRGWEPSRPHEIPVALFRRQMAELRASFRVVPLDRLLAEPDGDPRPLASVTFDDGYRDNFELAHPVLAELEIPAAVFVTTRWLGRRAPFWWFELEDLARRGALGATDRGSVWGGYAAEASRLKLLSEKARRGRIEELRRLACGEPSKDWEPEILSAEDLRAMDRSGLWTIGGHTHSHPILSRVSLDEARAEIVENKRLLEEILGRPLRWFAYPNGCAEDFSQEHVEMLRAAGFESALTGTSPWAGPALDPFRIPRVAVNGLEGLAEFRNHLRGIYWPRPPRRDPATSAPVLPTKRSTTENAAVHRGGLRRGQRVI